jgi:hypothetical protein
MEVAEVASCQTEQQRWTTVYDNPAAEPSPAQRIWNLVQETKENLLVSSELMLGIGLADPLPLQRQVSAAQVT